MMGHPSRRAARRRSSRGPRHLPCSRGDAMCDSRRLKRAHSTPSRRRACQPSARSRLVLHTRPDDHRPVECHASASALPHTGRMRHPTPLPAGLGAPAFSVAAARRAGVSRARLRASDLRRPHYGVRLIGSDDSLASRTQAYAERMPSNHHFSHLTAARVNGMRMPDGFRDGKLHVTAVGGGRAPRGARREHHRAQGTDCRHRAHPHRATPRVTAGVTRPAASGIHARSDLARSRWHPQRP